MRAGDTNQGIFAFNVTTLRDQRPDWYQADLTALFQLLERGQIAPPVAGRLELAQVAEAHRRLERADVAGKLVLLPGAHDEACAGGTTSMQNLRHTTVHIC
jgi:NADPH:quinone reductase-like Zn-dependent oxidoreductase